MTSRRRAGLFAAAVAVVLAVPELVGDYWLFTATQAAVQALAVLSVVVLFRAVGLLSLCQATLMGVAAFAMSWTAVRWDLPYLVAAGCGLAAAVAVGLLLALPALRMRGLELSVVTLAVALAGSTLVFSAAAPIKIGPYGATLPHSGFAGLSFGDPATVYRLVVTAAVLGLVTVFLVLDSPLGRTWETVRASHAAAASIGISITRAKLAAFALSAVLAGAAGVLFLTVQSTEGGGSFGPGASLALVIGAMLGGLERPLGMVVGGIALRLGPAVFTELELTGEWLDLVFGIVVVASIVATRGGLREPARG